MPLTLTQTPSNAAGVYASIVDLDDLRGPDSITSWSDLANQGIRDYARIQRAFNRTDAMIQKELENIYLFPLNQAMLTDADKMTLQVWSAVLTAYILYRNRGVASNNVTGKQINPFKAELDEVFDDIWEYRNLKRYLASTRITGGVKVAVASRTAVRAILRCPQEWLI